MIDSHIPLIPPDRLPESIRGAVAPSPENRPADIALASRFDKQGKARKPAEQQVYAIQNIKKLEAGSKNIHCPTLIATAKDIRELPGSLNVSAARMLPLSFYTENVAHFDAKVRTHGEAAAKALGDAERAYQQLRLRHAALNNNSAEDTGLFPEVMNPNQFFDKVSNQIKQPDSTIQDPCLSDFLAVGAHLHEHAANERQALIAKNHKTINEIFAEVFHHPSYRALARWISPDMRKKLMMWLNVIGMLTMIATIPLMVEGLKQWMQSIQHPQGSGTGQ